MKHIKISHEDELSSFPIAIVISRFNQEVTHELLQGTLKRLSDTGFLSDDITVIEVPGAGEIPLVAQCLAKKNKYAAIIALGAVIRGETTHYETVCQRVTDGCQQVSLEFGIPVIQAILTTENDEQAWDRVGGHHGHKGADAVDCARVMVTTLNQL